MTIDELIKKLEDFPPSLEVRIEVEKSGEATPRNFERRNDFIVTISDGA